MIFKVSTHIFCGQHSIVVYVLTWVSCLWPIILGWCVFVDSIFTFVGCFCQFVGSLSFISLTSWVNCLVQFFVCAIRCFDEFAMWLVKVLVIKLSDLLFAVYHKLGRFCIIFVAMFGSCIFSCSCSMSSSFLSLMFRIICRVVLRTASSLDQSYFLRTMNSRL